ncbi:hypothetical protein [Xanthomonas theicola]|uniref:hypothetical protein n=1 Tax=Xanthomonas theicola TaxID=56464 RepID=UPI001FECA169|nr:hypothetical protein [Xanthomonas theicola]
MKRILSSSTGDTHLLRYVIGDSPYGAFTYQGPLPSPVAGGTTRHSTCRFQGTWYLFHHDAMLCGGVNHLRSITRTERRHGAQGRIALLHPRGEPRAAAAGPPRAGIVNAGRRGAR